MRISGIISQPFYCKGSVYHACTFNDYHTLWCATETNDAGEFNHEWGHCDHDTCKGRVNTLLVKQT